MTLTEDLKHGLGVAFNEAQVLGIEIDEERVLVACTFKPLQVDKEGNVPEDRRMQVVLHPVGKLIASLRHGNWDDKTAVENFGPEKLLEKVQSFNSQPIYGWDFFNCGEEGIADWKDRLSLEWISGKENGFTNTFDIFQEGYKKHLDIRIWFDDIIIVRPNGERLDILEFIASGQRAWDSVYSKDEKANQFGIIPIDEDTKLNFE